MMGDDWIMHEQVLVIYPENVDLDDIMYPYQEIDKYVDDKIKDERCQFFLTLKEEDIRPMEDKIGEYLESNKQESLEMLQYRTEHSLAEFIEKYGDGYSKDCYNSYKYWCDQLEEYYYIKGMPIDCPRHIRFIKEFGGYATDKWIDIYIKGRGYGTFHNPYQLWDFYNIVNEHRFPSDCYFLISKNGEKSNTIRFNDLAVDKTICNIRKWTRVWENIIFCNGDPSNSRLYTINDIRFDKKCNQHCLIDNLEDKLVELYNCCDDNYIVTAIDFHW